MYRDFLEQHPSHPSGTIGLIKSLMGQGDSSESLFLLENFPANQEYASAKLLRPYTEALEDLEKMTKIPDTDLDATFWNSIRLARNGNLRAALDGLFDILRIDRHYQDERVRLVTLGLLELMGKEDPQTRKYRSELASILF